MISLNLRRRLSGLRRLSIFVFVITLLSIIFDTGIGITMTRKPPFNQFFSNGDSIFIASFTAIPEGSLYKIRNTQTTLDGVNVKIERGAVSIPMKIQLYINTGHLKLPDGVRHNNPILEIGIYSSEKLKKPIKILVPLISDKHPKTVSCFFISDNGSLSAVASTSPVMDDDKVTRFSFYTFHPGKFTWLYDS